jgi:hypothetical protein
MVDVPDTPMAVPVITVAPAWPRAVREAGVLMDGVEHTTVEKEDDVTAHGRPHTVTVVVFDVVAVKPRPVMVMDCPPPKPLVAGVNDVTCMHSQPVGQVPMSGRVGCAFLLTIARKISAHLTQELRVRNNTA